jgi:hypothetical protein
LIGSHSEYFRTALKANTFKVRAERYFEHHRGLSANRP